MNAIVTKDILFLREGTTYVKIRASEIIFIQADGNYAYLQTSSKRYTVKKSLSVITEELANPNFVRAARGLLVNFEWVDRISFADGCLNAGDHTLRIGKAYHASLKSRMPRL